jgi:hypothetical protein
MSFKFYRFIYWLLGSVPHGTNQPYNGTHPEGYKENQQAEDNGDWAIDNIAVPQLVHKEIKRAAHCTGQGSYDQRPYTP